MSSSVKLYTVRHGYNEIVLTVEIDFEKVTKEEISECAKNNLDHKLFLKHSNSDNIICFLKLFSKTCYQVSLAEEVSLCGLIDYFNTNEWWGSKPFATVSGLHGLQLIDFTYTELEPELFEVL